jgi:hypothetical protein
MAKLFFSYSHRDSDLRDEMEIHLAALKREGVIETWHDREIRAGEEFENEISQNLEEADIILLLISPYFIASNYCYEIEMKRAMQRHEKGDARVIPVILEPRDWQKLPFGKLTATPTDGKPISKFPNKHDGFLDVTRAIRNAAEDLCGSRTRQTSRDGHHGLRTGGRLKSRDLARATSALRKNLQIATKIVFLQMPLSISRISSRGRWMNSKNVIRGSKQTFGVSMRITLQRWRIDTEKK